MMNVDARERNCQLGSSADLVVDYVSYSPIFRNTHFLDRPLPCLGAYVGTLDDCID